jgi:uncharacterized cupredoxin-like copper-binding protein
MKRSLWVTVSALLLVALAACAPTTQQTPPSAAPTAAATSRPLSTLPSQAPTAVASPEVSATSSATEAATASATGSPTITTGTETPAALATGSATSVGESETPSALATGSPTTTTAGTPGALVTAAASQTTVTAAQTITVIATEFKFDPNTITVKVGQPVQIIMKNNGTVDHELEVEDLKASNAVLDLSQAGKIPEDERDEAMGDAAQGEVHAYAAAGGTATITFTPTTAGSYDFACNLPGHKDAGMTGTIVVQP